MKVITIKSKDYKAQQENLAILRELFLKTVEELKEAKQDKWMSVEEVAEFTGFSRDWVYDHKEDIGFFHNGGHLKFWKPDVMKFMELRSVKPKINKTLLKLQK
jgi:hypothetical protein